MGIRVTRHAAPDEEVMRGLFQAMNCPHPRTWSGGRDEFYQTHGHPYDKVLFCVSGTITFTDSEGVNFRLEPGDRLDVEAGTEHSARAGPQGVACIESFR